MTSALKGLEAAGKSSGGNRSDLLNAERYKNDYNKHSKEERTIVTQLGKTTFRVTVKDKSTGRTFCPLYPIVEFDERRLYQPDIAASRLCLSMS